MDATKIGLCVIKGGRTLAHVSLRRARNPEQAYCVVSLPAWLDSPEGAVIELRGEDGVIASAVVGKVKPSEASGRPNAYVTAGPVRVNITHGKESGLWTLRANAPAQF